MVYKFRWTNFPILWVRYYVWSIEWLPLFGSLFWMNSFLGSILLDVLKKHSWEKEFLSEKKLCRVSIASFRCSRFFEEIHLFRGLFIHDHTRFFWVPILKAKSSWSNEYLHALHAAHQRLQEIGANHSYTSIIYLQKLENTKKHKEYLHLITLINQPNNCPFAPRSLASVSVPGQICHGRGHRLPSKTGHTESSARSARPQHRWTSQLNTWSALGRNIVLFRKQEPIPSRCTSGLYALISHSCLLPKKKLSTMVAVPILATLLGTSIKQSIALLLAHGNPSRQVVLREHLDSCEEILDLEPPHPIGTLGSDVLIVKMCIWHVILPP